MPAIMTAAIQVERDVPLSYRVAECGRQFVTFEIGDVLNKVDVVVHDVADLDRLAQMVAQARDELVAVQSGQVA